MIIKRIYALILVLISMYYLTLPTVNAFDPNREAIFKRFMHSVIREDSPISDERVEMALKYQIFYQNQSRAQRLLAEAGWRSGFSLGLYRSNYMGSDLEIEWLRTELKKIGIYLEVI